MDSLYKHKGRLRHPAKLPLAILPSPNLPNGLTLLRYVKPKNAQLIPDILSSRRLIADCMAVQHSTF